YELQLERRARRSLERVPERDYLRLERAIDALAEKTRPRGAQKIRGPAPLWRIRVGDYRIIYAVFDQECIVKIVAVGRRSEHTYEDISR
ncbi:MAG: type II toxin-antitoxin system RelE/ParE family toxin, partial [Longimicrobiales bacterium]|nr:type II toxin-antitoxin system RelE/ParE family toxin [Longimicrobiales bacterium]